MAQLELSQQEIHDLLDGGSIVLSRVYSFINDEKDPEMKAALQEELDRYEALMERIGDLREED